MKADIAGFGLEFLIQSCVRTCRAVEAGNLCLWELKCV